MKKNFKHDCETCIFLGEFLFRDNFTRGVDPLIIRAADLYVCSQDEFPTVIARFSDESSNYISGIMLHDRHGFQHMALREAQLRAFSDDILEIKYNSENAKKYELENEGNTK